MNLDQNLTGPTNSLVSKVEIRVKCRNLMNRDVTSKSDPMVACYLLAGNNWIEIGRTENIKNNLNPDFAKPFAIDYYFEEVQKLLFKVYDLDNQTYDLSDDDYLGGIETTLSMVVAQNPLTQNLIRKGSKAGHGTITLIAEETQVSRNNLHLSFSARKLDNKDFFGKSDPYLEIRRILPDGSGILIHRTEVIKNNLNPTWATFILSGSAVNIDNPEQQLKLSCYDYDNDGGHDFIGETTITVENILEAQDTPIEWSCINPKKKAKKGAAYTDSGKIILRNCKVVRSYTFLDYIFGGCQINFTVGIDFTASNGNPAEPNSLHYFNGHHQNEYMQAISAVGAIIQDYDSDKMFPALGFGARIPPTSEVSHEFALNFNLSNPFCAGVQGILDAYRSCISHVQLYGPTNVSPIIYHVGRFAEVAHQQSTASNYYVLLILTDGVITDMNEARKAIVYVSRLPMSVIIVGVGNADFSDMRLLDGDDGILRAPDGTQAVRDIVQFVPFRKFQSSPPLLTKEVLAEIPSQVTSYFHLRGLTPASPPNK